MITDLSHNETLIPQSAENRLKLVFLCVCVSQWENHFGPRGFFDQGRLWLKDEAYIIQYFFTEHRPKVADFW